MTTFSDLKISSDTISRLKDIKIINPTKIQIETIKSLKNDLIVQSPTGTGKTLAYLIPIAEKLGKSSHQPISSVILVPTRELAIQVAQICNILHISNTVLIGGTDEVKNYCEIIIATPGRFNHFLLNSRNLKIENSKNSISNLLKKLDFLILDEADKLLSLGFRTQLNSIIRQIRANRNMLLSATFNENISKLCKNFLRSPKHIKNEQKIHLDIRYTKTTPFLKLFHLFEIFNKYERIIVFFLTCNEVDFFTDLFEVFGIKDIVKIHGKMEQEKRNKVYSSFKRILFGTDLAARGIDFKKVDIVVHFDIPLDPDSFLHRSGRSARNDEKGKALLLITENEMKYLNYLKIKNINIEEEQLQIDVDQSIRFISKSRTGNNCEMTIPSKPKDIQSNMNKISRHQLDGHIRDNLDANILIQHTFPSEFIVKGFICSLLNDRLLQTSVKAFVSHISAYKEHTLKFLLDFKQLDFDSLANLHFLNKIPTMKELNDFKFKHFVKNASQKT